MSTLLAVAAAAAIAQTCSWDQPGHNPYTGTPEAALAHYKDIPAEHRKTLISKIKSDRSDDTVTISRNGISGKMRQYYPEIKDMHFGANQVCRSTSRTKWKIEHREPGSVYCAGDHCVLIPKVCGNISRITRRPEGGAGPLIGSLYPNRGRLLPAPPPQTPIYDVSGPSGEEEPELPPPAAAPYFPIAESYGAPYRSASATNFAPYQPTGLVPFAPPGPPSPGRESPIPTSPIPEPYMWIELFGGLAVLLLTKRRRK
ncbi:MHFG family PEP-CTERM protein [Pseudoduganella rhizocola]|uniref:MHFG family PEP-CTERM protein n=1 Tax=Pseudoduganella rhizocola TaxID=3382643 RepID=UPI0038B6AD19